MRWCFFGYLRRRSFDCALRVRSEASVCLSYFSLEEVQFVGRKPSAEETRALMNLSPSLRPPPPCVINKSPSRAHRWLLLRTSLLSHLTAQSRSFKGKRPLTSDIKRGAHQRARDQGGTAGGRLLAPLSSHFKEKIPHDRTLRAGTWRFIEDVLLLSRSSRNGLQTHV